MEPTGKTSEEVEVPKLTENGRNWKIYCVKVIEPAAAMDITDPLGVLAGWQLDDGSYDWECLDAILKWTFYTTVPITILRPIRKLDTVHEIFNYLAKHFCDNNPIMDPHAKKSKPSANKVNGAGTATEDISTDSEKQKESPTSESAAAETLASANRDKEDLSTTKDLTRGTKSINDANVRRQDPRMSLEASVQGTSAKCTETTSVILKSVPHEMQTEPHSSLLLTPRLPIEGKPSACKQVVVDSVVTATCMNGTAKAAKPTEMVVDTDRTAPLGGELAIRVSGVSEGNETEHDGEPQLQQTIFYSKEDIQHSRNMNEDVPIAYRMPLDGEWTWCVSSEARDPKGDTNASDAATEHADHPSKLRVTEDANGVESEGCREGMSERASVDEVDGDAGRGTRPADTPSELTEFIAVSIKLEDLHGGDIPRMRLGGTQMRPGNANGCGRGVDVSRGLTDGSGAQMDAPNMSSRAETAVMKHGDEVGTYLGARDAKHIIYVTDGVETHADALIGCEDVQSIRADTVIPANTPEDIRTPRKKEKLADLPSRSKRRAPDKPDGCRNHMNPPSMHTDVHSIGNERETPANETDNVKTHQRIEKLQNSPNAHRIAMPKHAYQWRKVSTGNIDVYTPWNVPIEVLGRTFAFGQPEGREEAIAPRDVEGNGNRDGNDRGVGNLDGTTSSGDVDSRRVEAALLAGDSQHMCQNRRMWNSDLPMSSVPPI